MISTRYEMFRNGSGGRFSRWSVNRSSVFVKSVFMASFDLSNILFVTLGAVNHVNNIFGVAV